MIIRPYSTSNTFDWNSTGAAPGTEHFGVWVKDASSSNLYDAFNGITYTVTSGVHCSSVTLGTSTGSVVQGDGTHVTLTGSASGCPNPLYEFWAKWAGSNQWVIIRSYSSTATFDWNSTGALPGTETFGVWTKDASSGQLYDAFSSPQSVTVTAATCSSVTLTPASGTLAHGQGLHDILTAVASGCTHGTGQLYEFWMLVNGQWTIIQPYSTTNTFNWNTTGAPAGNYTFGVWAKDAKSSNLYDTFNSTTVTLT